MAVVSSALFLFFSLTAAAMASRGLQAAELASEQQLGSGEAADDLAPLSSPIWNYTLGPGDLRKSMMNCCNARMVALLRALEEGENVTVAVVGGSFSLPDHISSDDVWFSLWLKWLAARYPRANIKGINACVGASNAGLSFLCLKEMLPEPVDLVFVDYTPNLSSKLEIETKDLYLEQLFRALLARPERPVVMGVEQMLPESVFFKSAEVTTAPLYQFYDIPWISVRNSLFHHSANNETGFEATQMRVVVGGQAWHYNRHGHRMVADLAVYFFRAAESMMAQGLLEGQPDPFWQDGKKGHMALHRMLRPHPVRRPLGCVLAGDLPRFIAAQSSVGWNFTTDDRNGAKWGYISAYGAKEPPAVNASSLPKGVFISKTQPRLDLEWDAATFNASRGSGSFAFVLAYLASYEQTGYGSMSCSGACSCKETHIDAYIPEHSLTLVRPVAISLNPQAAGGSSVCRVSLANVSPGGRRFKFKVLGFILAELEAGMEKDMSLVSFMWHAGGLNTKPQVKHARKLLGRQLS